MLRIEEDALGPSGPPEQAKGVRMRKLAVALSKGGVGKTTTAVNLAAGLAGAGHRVLLIDTDTQGHVAKALGCQPEAGLAELVAGEATPQSAVTQARDRLWLLAGGKTLAGLKRIIARKDYGADQTLAEALAPLDEYDFVVVDTAPGWDTLTINALFYAQEVIAPVSLEVLTLQGLLDFAHSLTAIQRYHSALTLRYILPTFLDRRVRKSDEILGQLQTHFGSQVCAPIRYNVRLSEAPGDGQTIFEFAPHSPGAEDYRRLVERIIQK
jgi:chromosome partitioning protein